MKPKNYVKCRGCEWQLENFPDRDWNKEPCPNCHNTRQVVDPKELLCNLCGECMCPLGTYNEQYPDGLFEAMVTGGYDSYHLLDMNIYIFSLCEKCLRNMFDRCKIPPKVHDAISPIEDYTYADDKREYEYREFKRLGGFHQAYLEKRCNSVTDCDNKAVYTVLFSGDFSEYCCCEKHKSEHDNVVNAKLVKFIPNVLKSFL